MPVSESTYHLLYADTQNKLYLFLHSAIRAFAYSLISVFLPAFLISEMGQPLWVVFAFFALFFTIATTLCVFAAKITSRYGSKVSMVIGILFLIPYLYMMGVLTTNPQLVWVVAALGGIYEGFFFLPFHHDMCQMCGDKKSGSRIASFRIIMIIMTALAPLFGGLYTQWFSAESLLYLAAGLMALSIIPLAMSPRDHKPKKYSIHTAFAKARKNPPSKDILWAYFGACMIWVVGNISWPLIMYLQLSDYVKLGAITSVTTLVIVILLHLVGKRLGHKRGDKILNKVIKFQQASWGGIILATLFGFMSLPIIALLDTARRISNSITWTTIDHTTYVRAAKHPQNPVYPLFMRQISVNGTIAGFCAILALLYYLRPNMELLAISIVPVLVCIGFQRKIFAHDQDAHAKVNDEIQEINEIARA